MSLGKGAFLVSLSNLFTTLSNVILSVGLAWVFSDKQDYGKLYQILMFATFSASFLSGFPTGLSYFYAKNKSDKELRNKFFKRFFYSMFFLAIVICVLIHFFRERIATGFTNDLLISYFFLCIGIIFFRSISGFFINYFTLISHTKRLFTVNTIYFLMMLLFIAVLYLKPVGVSIAFILKGILFIDVIKFLFCFTSIAKNITLKGSFLVTKNELLYILPITGVTLINTLYIFVDKYMISLMLDPEAYANYQVGAFVIPVINIITGSIMVTLLPVFSELSSTEQYHKIIKILRDATKKTSLLLIPIFCYCLIFGKELIISIYSEKYAFSGEIFTVYVLRFFATVILFSLTMASIGLHNWVVVTAGLSLFVNVFFNYFLIKIYGVMGAVYATVITAYLGVIIPIYLINRKLKTTFFKYFPLKEYSFILIISLISSLMIYFFVFKLLSLSNEWSIILSIFYYIVILITCNSFMTIFSTEKINHLIREKLRKIK